MTYNPDHETLLHSLRRIATSLEADAARLRDLADAIGATAPEEFGGSHIGANVAGALASTVNNSSWVSAMETAIAAAYGLASQPRPAVVEEQPADLLEVLVSGKTYYGGLDPLATDAPKEHGWPEPDVRRQGKGRRMAYAVTPAQAGEMADHLECLAEGFAYSDSPEAKAEGRSFAKDAARIRALLTTTKEA